MSAAPDIGGLSQSVPTPGALCEPVASERCLYDNPENSQIEAKRQYATVFHGKCTIITKYMDLVETETAWFGILSAWLDIAPWGVISDLRPRTWE